MRGNAGGKKQIVLDYISEAVDRLANRLNVRVVKKIVEDSLLT